MRTACLLVLLAALVGGCSGNVAPTAGPAGTKERLPIEVERSPEEALPKKAVGR